MKIQGVSFLLVNGILFLFLLDLSLWEAPWTIIFAFLVFEALMDKVIGGGRGLFIIRKQSLRIGNTDYILWKQRTLYKGHAFLALFLMILGVTFLSTAIADIGLAITKYYFTVSFSEGLYFGVFWNFLASAGLVYYLSTFYAKP